MEIRLPDRRVPLEVYSTPLLDKTGKVVAAIAAFFDITERKQAEHLLADYNHTLEAKVSERTAELAEANELLKREITERQLIEGKLYSSTQQVRTIFESITDIVLIIDEQKTIQIIPTKRISGYTSGTNLLNSIVELFFQEDTEEIWFAKVRQVVETQQSINFDYSLRINNQEVWFTACISPLSNNSVVWVARDISDRIQVELELRKQKELRETIYNESTDALFLVDPKTLRITDCNRRAVELFEVTGQEDLIGIEGRTLQRGSFTPEEIDQIVAEMNQKGFWCREIEYVTRKGKVFWGNIAAKPVQIAGQVVHLVRVTDISDRIQVELELRKQKELRETIYNESTDALFLVDPKTLLNTDCNRRAVELFEVTGKEDLMGIEGRTLRRRPFTSEEMDQITTEMSQKGFWCREIEYVTRKGKVFWGNIAAKPVQIADQVVHLVRVTDISDRKRFEQAIRESEERFREIAGTISQCFFVRASTGEFLYVSPAYEKIWGRTCESLYQNPESWTETVHPDDRQLVQDSLTEQFNGNAVKRQYRIIRPDGQERWIVADISVVRDDAGQPLRFIGIAEDISDAYRQATQRKHAEQALIESEARFQAFMNYSPLLAWISDGDGKVLYCNRSVELWSQRAASELIGQTISSLHPPNIAQQHLENIRYVLNTRQVLETNESAFTPDGTLHEFLTYKFPLMEANGQCLVGGIAADITARKRAEEALQESQARLEKLTNNVPGAIYTVVLHTDGSMSFEYMSSAVRDIHEVEPEQVLENATLLFNQIHPDDRASYNLAVEINVQTLELFQHEWRIITPSGKLKWLQTTSKPERRSNEDIAWYGVIFDMTDQKQTEQQLQQAHQKLSFHVQNSPLAVIEWDSQFRVQSWSHRAEEIFGWKTEEVLGETMHEWRFIYEEDLDYVNQGANQMLSGTVPCTVGHNRNYTKEGTVIHCDWYTSMLLDESGNLVSVLSLTQDVSDRKRAEEALQRYERIVSATADGISLVDRNYIYQVVNQTYLTWRNQRYDEIVGHSLSEILGAQAFENVIKERFDQCLAGQTVQYQDWFKFASVGRRFLSVTYSPYLEVDNTISGVVVSLRDITELQQAEEALRESEAQLNMIVTNTCDGILILDEQNKIGFANPAAVELFNQPPEELIGYPWGMPLQETAEIELMGSNGQIRIAEMKAVRTTWQGESAYVVVLRDISDRKLAEEALRESANRERAIAQVLQRMRQSLDINTIFSTTTEGLRGVIKCDRVVVYQFNSNWSGEFVAESVADGWISLMQQQNHNPKASEKFLNDPRCTVETTILRGTPEPVVDSYLQETKGGAYSQGISYRVTQDIYQAGFTPCYIELLERFQIRAYIIVPLYWGNQLWGLLASYQNSDSRAWSEAEINTVVQIGIQLGVALQQAQLLQETQQQAVQLQHAAYAAEAANQAKSAFLANMSHELRTPLNGILGYAQILQRDKDCTPKQQHGINIIYQCGTHLLTLINDILDISKIEAGKLELHSEDFNFFSFLTGVIEIFRLKSLQKSIAFTYLPLNELPKAIHADEKRLRQVLMNLLSNAIKFTDNGSVTFKIEVMENWESGIGNEGETINNQQPTTNNKIRFQVEDTGIGIALEQLQKIFLPFEQVGDSLHRSEGTGLGLAITQKIVQMMGSQICVESNPGIGSKFWFDLDVPVVSAPIASTPVKSTDNIIGYSGSKRKILIVDDYWENRAVLINILEPIGFQLEEAVDGEDGLEKASEFQPDLILVDLVMPVMDGYQMTLQLRQFPEFQNTIIIAISANVFIVDQQKSLEFGCNDFLSKPIQVEEFLKKIQDYLSLSWIYEQPNAKQEIVTRLSEMVVPPPEALVSLYEAAQIGYIDGVEEEANRFKQLDPNYTTFANRVLELADQFAQEKIIELVERFFPKDIG